MNGLEMRTCLRCKTTFTAVLPRREAGTDYDGYYDARNLTIPAFVHRRLDELVGQFESYRHSNRWLDVGFGAGALLQAAARAGWTVRGTEVAAPAIHAMTANGFDVYHGELGDAPYEPGTFDVVTMIEVLEHVRQIDDLLRQAFVLLRPGGALYITTPHARGISARLLGLNWSAVAPPEHLQLISISGMRTTLARTGYAECSIGTHAVNPYELLRCMRSADRSFRGSARVATSYKLNRALSSSAWRTTVKDSINHVLTLTRLGDKLKCKAVRPG